MKIIFLGTPQFAVPSLAKLIESKYKVVGVVTQPDKPVGRSGKPVFSAVKKLALKHNLTVYQFNKLNSEAVQQLSELNADIMITCAFGQILSNEVLNLTPHGVYNIHGSILPKYRGASPIQWAIINGEKTTGITILKSDSGIDTGKVLLTAALSIKKHETYGELSIRLAQLGAESIVKALHQIETGTATLTKQKHELATVCKTFSSNAGKLDFNQPAEKVVNIIHGLNPSPVAFFNLHGKRYKVYRASIADNDILARNNINNLSVYKNGQIVVAKPKQGLIIKCSDGYVSILQIQAESGKVLDVKSFLNGNQIKEDTIV